MNTTTLWVLVVFFGPSHVVISDDIASKYYCEQLAKDIKEKFQKDYFIQSGCFSYKSPSK